MHAITAIIQARMSSSRLPGKVLRQISGQPMLAHVVERAKRAHLVDQVLVATTTGSDDNAIERFCAERGYPCYRGSLPDVLDRYYQAARQSQAGTIVRITADCPLLDPAVVDLTIQAFQGGFTPQQTGGYDFAANRLPPPWTRSLPIGLDVEVCSFAALERAWHEAHERFHREHVMPYLYEDVSLFPVQNSQVDLPYHLAHGVSPRGFRVIQLHHTPDQGSLRWTVDTPADLELVQQIFEHLMAPKDQVSSDPFDETIFPWHTVLSLVQSHPELSEINASIQHKTVFDVDTRTQA